MNYDNDDEDDGIDDDTLYTIHNNTLSVISHTRYWACRSHA